MEVEMERGHVIDDTILSVFVETAKEANIHIAGLRA